MFWEMQKRILDSLPKFHICHSSAFEYMTWIAIENMLKYIENTSRYTNLNGQETLGSILCL